MKSASFGYHAPTSVEDAVGLLADLGEDAKVLAGGQSLVPLLHFRLARPAEVVDINGLSELAYVRNGDGVELGAMVRHSDAERSDVLRTSAPLLAEAVPLIGHPAIRNRGTIGGSVAHADPAAELPAALLALDAELVATSRRGARTIPAGSFFAGFLTTALDADELLTAIRLPAWVPHRGWAFEEFSRRHGDFALVGVAAIVTADARGRIADARIALSGVASVPVRATAAEQLLTGEAPTNELWESVSRQAGAEVDPPADLHASTAYRRHLVATLTARALGRAWHRAHQAKDDA